MLAGVPTGPINDIGKAFDLAKLLGLDATVEIAGRAAPQVANPIRMSITPPHFACRRLDSTAMTCRWRPSAAWPPATAIPLP